MLTLQRYTHVSMVISVLYHTSASLAGSGNFICFVPYNQDKLLRASGKMIQHPSTEPESLKASHESRTFHELCFRNIEGFAGGLPMSNKVINVNDIKSGSLVRLF